MYGDRENVRGVIYIPISVRKYVINKHTKAIKCI